MIGRSGLQHILPIRCSEPAVGAAILVANKSHRGVADNRDSGASVAAQGRIIFEKSSLNRRLVENIRILNAKSAA